MTLEEVRRLSLEDLQALTHQQFEFAAYYEDGSIMFAGPLPDEYSASLHYERTATGGVTMGENDIGEWEDAWTAYITDLADTIADAPKPPKKRNRTRKQAEKTGAITTMPEVIALPTLKPYQNAISTVQDPAAHLQPVTQALAIVLTLLPRPSFDFGGLPFHFGHESRPPRRHLLPLPVRFGGRPGLCLGRSRYRLNLARRLSGPLCLLLGALGRLASSWDTIRACPAAIFFIRSDMGRGLLSVSDGTQDLVSSLSRSSDDFMVVTGTA